jgi:hypothetical protein
LYFYKPGQLRHLLRRAKQGLIESELVAELQAEDHAASPLRQINSTTETEETSKLERQDGTALCWPLKSKTYFLWCPFHFAGKAR